MTKEELLDIINDKEECEWAEYKTNYFAKDHKHEIGEYISALSNSAARCKQKYAYMIWGVDNNTREIKNSSFKYDTEIDGEVFKHYLARLLEPKIVFNFESIDINGNRVVVLTIPAAEKVPTEFDKERYLRIGSSKVQLRKYPQYEADLWNVLNKGDDITQIASHRKNLTFQILKNYLSTHNYHYQESTFESNLHLKNDKGEYNLMAELLADTNDIVVNVATFATTDKTEYLERKEFGGKCLLLAAEQVKDYIYSLNHTYVDTKVRPRIEKDMFDFEAFKEAWYNACVHYKWSEASNPGVYVYSDRLEIESFGGIPRNLTKTKFLQGVSKPVNDKLFAIFKTCGFVEESGHGVPTVTKVYGEDAYEFDGDFIFVKIPFDKGGLNTTKEIDNTTKETTKEIDNTTKETTQEKILSLLKANHLLTRKDLAKILKMSEDGIQYHLNQLKKKGKIVHRGATKAGYWEIIE